MGDKLLLKLNIYGKPIANKYCEGKVKRTLKRGLKLPEIVKREEFAISVPVGLVFYVFIKYGCNSDFGNLCGFDLGKTSGEEVALRSVISHHVLAWVGSRCIAAL
eukprot:132342_1